jgi:adenine-specific DNA-methyltransferase
VYNDSFKQDAGDYADNSGQIDEEGNQLVQNTESNGRFHTDWLNMIYPRLRLAKDLLTDDGVIFISIDDNEQENLRKCCDEVFGSSNFIAQIIWQRRTSPDMRKIISSAHEYLISYCKNNELRNEAYNKLQLTESDAENYSNPDNDPRGPWASSDFTAQGFRPNQMYKIITPGGAEYEPPVGRCWKNIETEFNRQVAEGRMWFGTDGRSIPRRKTYLSEREGKNSWTWWPNKEVGHTQEATKEVAKLMGSAAIFDYPKPVRLLKRVLQIASKKDSLVLDFFSGSATLAHATMQLNSEDGGERKFLLVQLPETTNSVSEAFKAGYETICDIGEERICRAGKKIKEENPLITQNLDIGFRCFAVDSSNMKDVYYKPSEYGQMDMDSFMDNIKEERTPEDLLIQVMLDLGIPLSSKIEQIEIAGKNVFSVADEYLIACFDKNVMDATVIEIAKRKPFYAVLRDSGMASDSVAANFEQIFETYSPNTIRKVL